MSNQLPDDWEYKSLSELSSLITKGATPSSYGFQYVSKPEQGGVKFIRGNNATISGKFNSKDIKYICNDAHQYLKRSQLKNGDVIISIVGSIGTSLFVDDNVIPANINQNVALIRPNQIIDNRFLLQVITSPIIQKLVALEATTQAQPSLSLKQIGDFVSPVPPLPEQQKIAAILTSVDDVIEKKQAQINKLKDLKTGMMQELLTRGVGVDGKPHTEFKDSPVGRIPKGWDVVNVGSLVEVIDPQPDHRTPPEVENGIPYVGLGDIDKSGVINFSSARKVSEAAFDKQCRSFDIHKGAFIFGKIGTIGNPSILPNNRFYCLSANVILITCSDIDLLMFIYQIFTSELINEQVKQQTNTTSQPALGIKKVRDFLVPYPSKEEMRALVNTLISIDQRIAKLDLKFAKYKLNKKALMQDLLTGKVRVNVE